ncbi:MAG: hypothetical protein QHC90_09335 [Shinella sp.]|nr:hypothetical protein [Shinella sp.]
MADPANLKGYDFERYKDPEVKHQLELLFYGKCAYCESFYAGTQPVDVEHYRPKAEVEEVAGHRGYWWLAMNWENLLPSCIDCNRRRTQRSPSALAARPLRLLPDGTFSESEERLSGKASSFPLATEVGRAALPSDDIESEARLLIDPTRDDPSEHIGFNLDNEHAIGLILPAAAGALPAGPPSPHPAEGLLATAAALKVSAMGLVSIRVYGLNRLGLVQARTRVLRDLEFLVELAINLSVLIEEISGHVASLKLGAAVPSEIEFHERVAKKLRQFHSSIIRNIKEKTEPKAAFSEMAKAWVARYLET